MSALAGLGFSADDLLASICRDSFLSFFEEMWSTTVPEPLIMNWHIKALCTEMQRIAERVFRNEPKEYDFVANVSPGTSKSLICSVMFPAWVWTRMPSARMICASFDKSLVQDLSLRCRDVIESKKYRALFPEVQLREDARAKGKFATTAGGVRYTATVSGQSPMGRHSHFNIVDDPIDPREALSAEKIKGALRFMNNILPSRRINKEVTPTILVMQRLAMEDPTGDWLARKPKAIKHYCFPAEITEKVRPVKFRKYYKDGLMDPKRLTRKVLDEYRLEGEHFYAGQFLQDPIPEGGLMFNTRILSQNIRVLPPGIKFVRICRYWDKAYSDGSGCYTVGLLMGVTIGKDKKQHFWVMDVVRGQWAPDEREARIRMTAEKDYDDWGDDCIQWVEREPAAGKESAAGTLRTLAGFRVKEDLRGGRSDGDKVKRADAAAAQVNVGNVSLVKGSWNSDFIRELERFPNAVLKDQVDGFSGAFNKLAKRRRRVGAFGRSSAA